MKRRLVSIAAGVIAAALLAAPASAEDDAAANYTVIEEDARIAFASSISGFERPQDDVLLIRVGANRWYRAKLNGLCGRDAVFDQTIYFRTRGPTGVDRWSHVVIDDRVCGIEALDRIENPHPIGS
jgi:hypothetical protein